jgi:cystathionine beta-lyase
MIATPAPALLRMRTGRKWSAAGADVLPAWIADMDFDPAPAIRRTLEEAIRLGDLGYGPAATTSGVPEAFAAWAQRRWSWQVEPADVMVMPDVVGGIANCIEALTEMGDAILVQTPAYPPLLGAVRSAGRTLIEQPIGRGPIDLDALDALLSAQRVRMILLCHPHNPLGRVFDAAELGAIAALAERHDLVIVSDEVHADLAFPERAHRPFAPFAPDRTVTLNAPSKAFNVAGLRTAICVAPPALRARLAALPPTRWSAFSTMGVRAALAAWSDEGATWLDSCLVHLMALRDRIAGRLPPAILYDPPDASYLAWLDCRALGLDDPAGFFLERARVQLSPGLDFGAPGTGHVRLNFATSAEILDEMLDRMSRALS